MERVTLERALPAGDRILLDSTVLAAYLDDSEPTHPIATTIINDFVGSGRNEAVIAMVTVMEVLVRPLRRAPVGHHTVLAFIKHQAHMEAVPLDLQMAQEAASLRASHRLSAPDALIVGTGIAAQVGHLITNDHRWSAKLAPIRDRIGVITIDDFMQAA